MHVWFKKLKKKDRPGSHLPILKVWIIVDAKTFATIKKSSQTTMRFPFSNQLPRERKFSKY